MHTIVKATMHWAPQSWHKLDPRIKFKGEPLFSQADASHSRLWSEVSEIRGRAQSALPHRPPRTFTGSFEVVNGLTDRAVYVYWQQINPSERNGPDFGYAVTEVLEAGRPKPIHPSNVTGAYALFPKISLKQHKFFVAARNILGNSQELSEVIVPHHDQSKQHVNCVFPS